MGQTLTHGIYLPDEGERNCYSGLAANWQILDNSVGTIAAHTAALAGKAPLVHTHTKSDITDFPVYGNTAGNWYDCNLVLISEIEMFGSNRFSSSGMDDLICPEGQIAAFKYNRNLQTLNRTINTWLRNVNSSSRFCACIYYGNSGRFGAPNTGIRLRPRFLIG